MNSNMEEDNINEEYRSSLADLTCNSKPLISMLTMLAEDNLENAREIVKVIESHLQKVGPEIKLPVMYLIDSIVKNVGRQYLNLFTQSIVSNFCSVFEKVDEKTRMQLFKLRQTWNGIFPNKKLYAIDARVNAIDPAWPITAEKPPQQTIHVNPKFFENKQSPQPTKIIPENEVKSQEELQEEVRKQLWAKQQELLKLQQQKLELELMQTKAKLEEQTRLLNMHDKEVRSVDPRLTRLDPRISLRDPRLHKMTPGTTASPIGQNSTPTVMSFGNRQRIGTELQNPPNNQMNFTNASHTPNSQMKLGSSHSVLPSFPAKSELNNNSNNNNVLTKIVSSSTENSVSQCTNGNKNMNSQSLSEGKSNIPKHSVTNLRTSENSKISGKKVKKDDSQDVKNNEDMSKKNISPKKVSSGKKNTSNKKMKNFEHDDDKLSREKKEISQNKANINKSVIKEKDRVNENEIINIQHSELKTRKRRNLDKTSKNNWEAEENSRRDNSKVHRSTKSQSKVIKSEENEQTRKVSERERSRSPLKKAEKHSKKSDNVRSNNQESSNKSKLNQEVKNRVSESNVIIKKSDSCTKDQTTRDIDLRLLSSNTEKISHEGHKSSSKRELDQKLLKDEESKENEEEPPIKKAKEGRLDNLFGIQDQDYRQISQMSDLNLDKNVNQKGWAQYKAIHPDEFKSPLRPSRENMDGSIDKISEREQEERFDFHGGDPRMYGYDSLGRPRRRMRNDRFFKQSSFDRFKGHYNQFGRDQQQVKAQMELMLANEKEILRQAEQQLHSGRMTNEQYEDLRAQLENLYDRKRLDDFHSLPKKNFARFNIPDKEFLNERYDKTSRRTDFINDKRPQGNFIYCTIVTIFTNHQVFHENGNFMYTMKFTNMTLYMMWPCILGFRPQLVRIIEVLLYLILEQNNKLIILFLQLFTDKISEREQEERFDFHGGDPRMYGYDSLGRPRRRMRNDRFFKQSSFDRFKGHYNQFGRDQQQVKAQMELMLANEKEILRQAEQQLHSGRMTNEQYEDLRAQLENLYDRKRLDDFHSLPKKNFARFNIPDKEFLNERYDKTSRRTDFINDKRPQGNFTVKDDSDDVMQEEKTRRVNKEEKLKDQSSLPPVRSIVIDKQLRKIHFVGQTGVIMMENDDPREISFKGAPKKVFIDDMEPLLLGFGGEVKEFEIEGKKHTIKFGAPSRELYIDDYPYEARFGGPSIKLFLDDAVHTIHLEGPPPNVQISEESRKDLLKDLAFLNDKQGKDLASSGNESKKGNSVKGESNKIESLDSKTDSQQSNSNNSVVNKDVDLRSEKQKKADSNKDQDFRKSDSLVEDISHDIDMRSVPEKEENIIEKNLSINQDLQNNRESSKEEVPLSSFKDIDWRPVLLTAESSSPNRSPSTREHSEQNEEKRHTHLDEKEFTQQPVDKTRMQNSPVTSVKRLVNERYPTTVHSSYRDSPPYWNQERMWDNPSRIETSVASSVKKDDRDVTMSSRHIEWDSQKFTTNIYVFLNFSPRFPVRGSSPLREQMGFGLHRRLGPRQLIRLHQDNFPRPMLMGNPDMPAPPSVLRANLNQHSSSLGLGPPLPSYPQQFPTSGQRFNTETSQEVPYEAIAPNKNETVNIAEAISIQPKSEVSNSTTFTNALPSLDVQTLFEKLVAAGIIPESKTSTSEESDNKNKSTEEKEVKESTSEEKIPPIEFTNESLKARYNGVISALYRGAQCASCGLRFTEGQHERYSQHLDWHFRVNRREKDGAKKAFSRKWFYDVEDWIQFEEIEDLEERARSFFELQADEEQFQIADQTEIPSVPAADNEEKNSCVVCREHFEQFWVEEEEEWHLKYAIREIEHGQWDWNEPSQYGKGVMERRPVLRENRWTEYPHPPKPLMGPRRDDPLPPHSTHPVPGKPPYGKDQWISASQINRNSLWPDRRHASDGWDWRDDFKRGPRCLPFRPNWESPPHHEEYPTYYREGPPPPPPPPRPPPGPPGPPPRPPYHNMYPYHPLCYEDFKKASEAPETPVEVRKTDPLAAAISVENIKKEIDKENIEKEIKEEPKDEEEEEESKETTEKDDSVIDTQPIDQDTISDEKETTNVEVVIKEEPLDNEKEEDVEKEQNEESISEEIKVDENSIEEETPNDIPVMELCNLTSGATLEEEEIRPEAKKIILKSGGIVMKVRADSIALPASPNSNAKPPTTESSECEEIKEMEYPPPDPRFKVLPPVQRGKELSGLCTIM
ncbi:uncharacterized protein LOC111642603 [Centruroides sculpturatus]|uniref:uncharacterized protein LOC111642603 n=1 Tax=Centruroides sculpturatus TaxID=218467 RepID=UPI000C6CAF9D|nr:uncharacterized protein LOC111642603 [Centruroides sculpturatus]